MEKLTTASAFRGIKNHLKLSSDQIFFFPQESTIIKALTSNTKNKNNKLKCYFPQDLEGITNVVTFGGAPLRSKCTTRLAGM